MPVSVRSAPNCELPLTLSSPSTLRVGLPRYLCSLAADIHTSWKSKKRLINSTRPPGFMQHIAGTKKIAQSAPFLCGLGQRARGGGNRAHDFVISCTPTKVAGQGQADFVRRGIGVLLEQRFR